MKIQDWIKKLFRINITKQIEAPKEDNEKNIWKQKMKYIPNIEKEEVPLTEEQMRTKQIKDMEFTILFKEGDLLKNDIINILEQKGNIVVLNDAEIEALRSIQGVMQYEDLHGENNIREFIDDDENNIVKLVDKIVENAKKEAQKYEMEDISRFVTSDCKVMNELKENIIKENENDIEKYDD